MSSVPEQDETLKLTFDKPWQIALFRAFKFFASLRLAIFLLFTLIVVFSAGTIIESRYGMRAAQLLVYQADWFVIIGFLFVANLSASAVDRMPWKKKHIPFVMTHLGIITVLIGSWITNETMIDAQMVVEEGKSSGQIELTEPLLYIFSDKTKREWPVALPEKAFPWDGEKELDRTINGAAIPVELNIKSYYPKGSLQQKVVPSENGSPALKLRIKNSFMDQEFWLKENDPGYGEKEMGPAIFSFKDQPMKPSYGTLTEAGYLEINLEETNIRIALEDGGHFPTIYPIPELKGQIAILNLYKNAVIIDAKIQEYEEAKEERGNPAVVFLLQSEEVNEKHTAFARFPDFPTMHGMKPSATGATIYYRMPEGGSAKETHELRFLMENEKLKWQIQDGFEIREGFIEKGGVEKAGWMDLEFEILEFYPKARVERSFLPESNQKEGAGIFSAIQLEATKQGNTQTFWLAQEFPSRVQFGNSAFYFLFGQEKKKVDFKIHLDDFRVVKYPGSTKAASFESDVTVQDPSMAEDKKVTISMNEPLDHGGFRIFQASYVEEEGKPDKSVFAVVKDPGIWVKYMGTIIMISGIMWMFFSGRFNFRKKEAKA